MNRLSKKPVGLTPEERAEWRARVSELMYLERESWRFNWPMHVFELVKDFGFATCLGVALGLSVAIYALEWAVL